MHSTYTNCIWSGMSLVGKKCRMISAFLGLESLWVMESKKREQFCVFIPSLIPSPLSTSHRPNGSVLPGARAWTRNPPIFRCLELPTAVRIRTATHRKRSALRAVFSSLNKRLIRPFDLMSREWFQSNIGKFGHALPTWSSFKMRWPLQNFQRLFPPFNQGATAAKWPLNSVSSEFSTGQLTA